MISPLPKALMLIEERRTGGARMWEIARELNLLGATAHYEKASGSLAL